MEVGQVVFVKGLDKYGRVAMTTPKKCKRLLVRFVFMSLIGGTYYEYIAVEKDNITLLD